MRKSQRAALCLEGLEDRRVPATIQFHHGILSISDEKIVAGKTNLTVTQTAPDTFQVVDGASKGMPTFSGVSSINIRGTNASDTVTVDLGAFTYSGSLTAYASNGNDTFNLKSEGGAMAGNLTVFEGRGNDTVSLNQLGSTGALTIAGNTRIDAGNGNDSLQVGNGTAATTFRGDFSVSGINNVNIGNGSADVFRDELTVNLGSNPHPLDLSIAEFQATPVNIFDNLQVTGGPGDDLVVLGALTAHRNVNVDLRGGDATIGNDLSITASLAANPAPTTIFGNLNYHSTAVVDIVDLAGGVIDGDVTLHLGVGGLTPATASGVALDSVDPALPTIIGGNLLITGGNGDFTSNPFGAGGNDIQAQIGGDVTFRFGNGDNSITFAPGSSIGGRFNYHAGNGDNSVTLAGAQTYLVNVHMGTGVNTFVLNNAGAVLTGLISGGGNPASMFKQIAGTIGSPFTLKGLP